MRQKLKKIALGNQMTHRLQTNNILSVADFTAKNQFNINPETFLSIPNCHVYWKNQDGEFIGCNDLMAESLELSNRFGIIGKTDYDLPILPKDADKFRENDQQVMQNQMVFEFKEISAAIDTRIKTTFQSTKIPLFNKTGKVTGILGLTRILHQEKMTDIPILTYRQEECLYYLVQGMTIKETAQELGLSPKTIEHYLEAIKYKLSCHTRSALIKKALQLDSVRKKILTQ